MSYRIYPVTDTPLTCNDYTVRINGEEVKLNTARVSAVPFSRRWPGHQRSLDQTEIIQFLSLAADEPLAIEIIPRLPFESVKIRPASLGITPEAENGAIKFTLDSPAYLTVEPYGRSRALHIFADAMPSYDIDISSPHVIYFGEGEHDIGLLKLKSNQTVYIDEGAVVYGSIHATDAENIRIIGRGILDNSRNVERIIYEANAEDNDEAVCNAERIHTIQLEYCKSILIDGITIRDSLVYNIRPIACEDVRIRGVKIIGCWRYNSDGIDMHNCRNVHISDCFIRTFDDSICVKGFDFFAGDDIDAAIKAATYRNGGTYDVFRNALIEGCVIWNDWGKALEVGAEAKAREITDITFRNCDLIHLCGKALDCMNVDYADMHDITFSDIRIECDEEIPMPAIQASDGEVYESASPDYMPLTVRVSVEYHHEYSRGSAAKRGKIRNLVFESIKVIGDKAPIISCYGYDGEHKVENIRIVNLSLNGEPISSLAAERWLIGDFTENISLTYNPYLQTEKNSVSARGQLKETQMVKFHRPEAKGTRIMFVGNSITLHGIREEIGWHGLWGMAASAREKDYVHLVEEAILVEDPDASFCICQVAAWENAYKDGRATYPLFAAARDFEADIIVVRCIENCPKNDFDSELFTAELKSLIDYLSGRRSPRLLVTTAFWRHPGDVALRKYAEERGYPAIELGDLGENDAMKATGLFEHRGVANHPGDQGMRSIAERITAPLLHIVREIKESR